MAKFSLDWWLVLPSLGLLLLGLTLLRSVAPELVIYQLSFAVLAILIFIVFSLVDYKIILSLHLPIYVLCLIFLLTPFAFGNISRGALRWIQLGQISIQPSEIIKPFLLLTFSYLAARRKLVLLIPAFIFPIMIVFLQPDLGTTLVITISWLTIFLAKLSTKLVILFIGIAVLLLPAGWFLLHDYQRDRLLTFVNPYRDPLGKGYHVIQSVIAVGSGGLMGRGLGQGTQSQLRFLPERHTDFIFASLTEELGFVGGGAAIILFSLLLYRTFVISQVAPDSSSSLFLLSVLSMFTFQIFVNIGMNMGLAPITGITLPFLSYGGSSLVSLGITLGIITSISRQTVSSNYSFPIH